MAVQAWRQSVFIGVLLTAIRANGHGIATALVQWPEGIYYAGYNPSYQYSNPPPVVVGWSTPDDLSNTFVSPQSYGTGDIACHIKATPAGLEAPVNAGDVLAIRWAQWPASHHGPVIDYLANCNGPCTTVDKTKLKFFKIDEVGLLDASKELWGADVLLGNNLTWVVRLPLDIAPGNYVLRHEMIALHAAGNANGAQNYPFCFSLAISGNGTAKPEGVLATQLYKATDPGILYDLFTRHSTYVIPGPPLYTGALSVAQSKPVAPKATSVGVASYVAVAKATSAASGGAAASQVASSAAAPASSAAAAATPPVPTPARAAPTAAAPTAARPPYSNGGMGGMGGMRPVTSTTIMTTRRTSTRRIFVTMTTTMAKVRREEK